MLGHIHVKNFRSLRDLSIEDLGRVNLFVGPNNVGKTSLLEIVWLLQAPGNPSLTGNLAYFRGFDPVPGTPHLLWDGLFHNMSPNNEIEIQGTEVSGNKHCLRVSFSKSPVAQVTSVSEGTTGPGLNQARDTSALPVEILQYEYTLNDEQPIPNTATVSGDGIASPFNRTISPRQSIFLSARKWTNALEMAERFTKVDDAGWKDVLVESLQTIEPKLKNLSLGYVEGRLLLRGQVDPVDHPIPLLLLGGGVVRLAEVLLALMQARDGLALIDEIENGFYYEKLEPAWRAINFASRRANAQIFATTHSYECLQAATRAFEGEFASDFRLHRLERKDGDIRVVTYDHETARAAVDMNFEVR